MLYEGRELIIKEPDTLVGLDTAIIMLHGATGTPDFIHDRIDDVLPQDVLRVYPSADETKLWQAGGLFGYSSMDVLYLSGLVFRLILLHPTLTRIFIGGHSLGGMMAYRAAKLVPYDFAGVIGISTTFFDELNYPNKVLHIHGLADDLVKVDGVVTAGGILLYSPLMERVQQFPKGSRTILLSGVGHKLDDVLANVDMLKEVTKYINT